MKSHIKLMTQGPIARAIFTFAIPIFLSNLFQQLYNIVDAIVVGNYVGKEALAAITSIGPFTFLLVGFFNGIFIGAGVVISKYFGAQDYDNVHQAIHTSCALAIVFSIFFTLFGYLITPRVLSLMQTPPSVYALANTYTKTYMLGMTALIFYNMSTGILQAFGDSKNPLYFLMVGTILNIILDCILVGKLGFGIHGAIYATVISEYITAILATTVLIRTHEIYKINLKEIKFSKRILFQLLHIGVPSGLQNSIISISNIFIQGSINTFGAIAMAGNGAYLRIEGFVFLPIASFAMAITTFIGQNIGASQYTRVKKGIHFSILFSLILCEFFGVFLYFMIPSLMTWFTQDPEVIAIGVEKAHITCFFFFLLAFSHVMAGVFRGAGKAIVPMLVMLFFWCFVRVIYVSIILIYFPHIQQIFWAYPITWVLSTMMFIVYYFKADWLPEPKEKIL